MKTIDLAAAKAHFSELLAQAESGEPICITRHGKPVAQLAAVETARRPISLSALRQLTESMPPQAESAGSFVRPMRDEDRY